MQTITIKGARVEGPPLAMVPNGSIAINVKEEFTGPDRTTPGSTTINGRPLILKGPNRYLNVTLERADDFWKRTNDLPEWAARRRVNRR